MIPTASKSPLRVVDGGKRRVPEVPLNGPTHQMLKNAVLPLDTLRELDVFKNGLRLVMAELARNSGIGMPATIDAVQDVIKEFTEEMVQ
jgi:hypothetical protein